MGCCSTWRRRRNLPSQTKSSTSAKKCRWAGHPAKGTKTLWRRNVLLEVMSGLKWLSWTKLERQASSSEPAAFCASFFRAHSCVTTWSLDELSKFSSKTTWTSKALCASPVSPSVLYIILSNKQCVTQKGIVFKSAYRFDNWLIPIISILHNIASFFIYLSNSFTLSI